MIEASITRREREFTCRSIFADDTIGVGADGQLARVDQDVVVTAIVPSRDGGVLVWLRSFSDGWSAG